MRRKKKKKLAAEAACEGEQRASSEKGGSHERAWARWLCVQRRKEEVQAAGRGDRAAARKRRAGCSAKVAARRRKLVRAKEKKRAGREARRMRGRAGMRWRLRREGREAGAGLRVEEEGCGGQGSPAARVAREKEELAHKGQQHKLLQARRREESCWPERGGSKVEVALGEAAARGAGRRKGGEELGSDGGAGRAKEKRE